jgi:Mrp family chromosome partitioning ATPase
MVAYPPLPNYQQTTPAAGRRASYRPGEGSPDAEPPVNDAPLAPETSITVQSAKLAENIDPHIVLLSDAYSDRADAYRALRRKLASSNNPRVIAVTSPEPGEGKTTCAINLALTMREGARGKVLLLEANVRAPSIARVLGFEPPECFIEQLNRHREDPRQPWLAVEPLPQLHVMAVDTKIKHAPLIDAVAFSSGMERLKRAGYEYIVIDTPPVIGSFEVNMIADAVDGVVFATITMKSRKSAIRKAIEQVMPAPVLGVVVLDA